uniref:DUF2622 domain-containing protein n=1 Tax=Ralstonia solanacearum TaxID=305 RepID=A0A0S4V3R3_RALSL|nr:conserved protein of unknown function [Ralstonia solanacearum]
MASFTTRVVLHNADPDDYTDVLHPAMAKQGFTRTIKGDSGKTYDMPDAEYDFVGDKTRDEVLERAKTATQTTKKEYAIFVTEAVGRCWYGLDTATK